MRLSIVIDRTVHEIAAKTLALLGEVNIVDTTEMTDDLIRTVDILIIRTATKVDKLFLKKAKNLKIIATATTGMDHIDVETARVKGIKVLTAKGENADAVADYVMRMLLIVTDDVFYTNKLLKATQDFKNIKKANVRRELRYKTLGIIGYGNVGTRVARRAKAFGMQVKTYDPYVAEARHTLQDVLMCDVVTLHPELTDETKFMIEDAQLRMMKPHAILINAARGEVVREQALLKALKNKWIRLAILDVFENEPGYTELYQLENAIVTPHIAGNTVEAKINAAKRIAEVIIEHMGLEQPLEVMAR